MGSARVLARGEKSEYSMLAFIAGKLNKSGGGHPSRQALGQFFAKVDVDTSRFPGKLEGEQHDIHTLGDSRTGAYSYDVWLWRVPIVVTVDLSAAWNPAEPWIQANSLRVFLDRGCWQERV